MNSYTKIKRLPRYTSYPTALEFQELDSMTYDNWLTTLDIEEPVSLYIHIPYCNKLCWFCGCFMKVSNKYETVEKYVDTLIKEIKLVSRKSGRKNVSHIHFGGGSPTILKPKDFCRIIAELRVNFNIQSGAEIAIEIDPRTLSEEKIAAYSKSGVNRVSMGIQDFNNDVQKAVNRIQSQELIEECLGWIKKHNIAHVNFDLIYGLPLQTTKTIENTVSKAASYRPSRISLFGYAHVPWVKKHMQMIEQNTLPTPAQRKMMFDLATEILIDKGYEAIGLDHFALPQDELAIAKNNGTLKRNFQGYTTDIATTMIGFGISSIGSFPNGFSKNTSSFNDYFQQLSNETLPIKHGLKITKNDLMRRNIISDLMCFSNFNPSDIAIKYGLSEDFKAERNSLKRLVAKGFLAKEKDTYSLTKKGAPYRRAVATIFDEYFPQDTDILDRCLLESEG